MSGETKRFIWWLDLGPASDACLDGEHPRDCIMRHFPDATDLVPRSMMDAWHFTAAARDGMPSYFKMNQEAG